MFRRIAVELVEDLNERGKIDIREAFIDGSFAPAKKGVLLSARHIAPHRKGRRKPKTQDGRKLRRYRRRWKVERLFAWLQNYRR